MLLPWPIFAFHSGTILFHRLSSALFWYPLVAFDEIRAPCPNTAFIGHHLAGLEPCVDLIVAGLHLLGEAISEIALFFEFGLKFGDAPISVMEIGFKLGDLLLGVGSHGRAPETIR